MNPVDVQAETVAGYHWSCTACAFSTPSLTAALRHCEDRSADYPAHEHLLRELPSTTERRRNLARRVVACRDESGRALNARVTAGRWRVIDGRYEIAGVTVIHR